MIDIDNEVFDLCYKAVTAVSADAFVSSVYVTAPASFPAVSIIETEPGTTDESRLDSSGLDRGEYVSYQVRAFSNRRTGAKSEAKSLIGAVDSVLLPLNFVKTYSEVILDKSNTSIVQVVATYQAGVDENKRIYRR